MDFHIKRDDLTPLAAGGNKLRKLEYFLKDAKDKGATFLLTVGGAYNNPVKEVRDAMYYMAEKDAIILDPCYTGKCFAGILEMIKSGEIAKGETIVMLHTGGLPGINTPFHRIEIEHERDKFIHVIK